MALTANETRALRALRAGPLAREQTEQRWASGAKELCSLARAGLAEKVGGEFRITPAGRAACQPVNPLLARTPAEPKEQTPMPRNKTTTSDVFDAICAAGPDGTTVIALSSLLAVSDQTIFNHLKSLTREPGAVVRRPRKGLLVASRYLDGAPESADEPAVVEAPGVPEAEVEKIARDYAEMIDFDLEAAQSVDLTATATPNVALATSDLEARYHALRAEVGGLLDAISTAVGIKDAAEARVKELERLLHAFENGARYAVAFESDFHDSIESAVRRASECYDKDSLSTAIVIACTPLGSIDTRWVFVPRGAA